MYDYAKLGELPSNGIICVYGVVQKIEVTRERGMVIYLRDETAIVPVRVDRDSVVMLEGIKRRYILRIHRGLVKAVGTDKKEISLRVGANGCHAVVWKNKCHDPNNYLLITSKKCTISQQDYVELKLLNNLKDEDGASTAEAIANAADETENEARDNEAMDASLKKKVFAEMLPGRVQTPVQPNKQAPQKSDAPSSSTKPAVVSHASADKEGLFSNTINEIAKIFGLKSIEHAFDLGRQLVDVRRSIDDDLQEMYTSRIDFPVCFEHYFRVNLTLFDVPKAAIVNWQMQCRKCNENFGVKRSTRLFCATCKRKDGDLNPVELLMNVCVPSTVELFSGHVALIYFDIPSHFLKGSLKGGILDETTVEKAYGEESEESFNAWQENLKAALKEFFTTQEICPSVCFPVAIVPNQNLARISVVHPLFSSF